MRGGDRIAFRWRPEGTETERSMSYSALRRSADAVGSRLIDSGLSRGDAVAILSENRPEWCAAYLGIAATGFIVVPLDASLDESGVMRNIVASRSRALFGSARLLKRMPGATAIPGLALIVDFDAPPPGPEFAMPDAAVNHAAVPGAAPRRVNISWAELLDSQPSAALPRPGELGQNAQAVVFFTSGTTGIAKGITLTHGAVLANVDASRNALFVDSDDVFVALLPLHHTYATTCSFLSSVDAGCTCVVVDRIAPSAVLRAIREGGVTFLIGVPLLFDKLKGGIEAELAKLPSLPRVLLRILLTLCRLAAVRGGFRLGVPAFRFLRKKAGLGSVRLAVSGGGPLAASTADFFDAIGIDIVQGYGMSENGPLISVNLPGNKDNRSVGLPVKRTEIRIDDPDELGIGEIQVRSPSLMLGYIDQPEATKEVFTEDGWLKTGDLGRLDARGFLFITGRRKSLIVTEGGKNVYPEEIEARFEGSAWIKEVLVVGRLSRSGRPGEEIVAVCVPDYEKIATAHRDGASNEALIRGLIRDEVFRVNKGLAPYMKMADFVIRSEEFEKTSTRKIKRFLYREYAKPNKR